MKNKLTETNFKSAVGGIGHLFGRVACLGAVILTCSSALAQNLFVTGLTGWDGVSGAIFEFTPDGTQSIFVSGLSYPQGLAFDNAGNLFVVENGTGSILKFTVRRL